MNLLPDDSSVALRRGIYLVLIAIGIGGIVGRIMAVNAVDKVALEQYLRNQGRKDWEKQRPFLSGNDRSRWCTVRALVEHGTYTIDDIVTQPNWDTIDMVKHDDQGHAAPAVGEGRLYSSKPPLLATLIAGPYWVLNKLTGATFGTHPYAVGRFMLILCNVLPLIVYFWLLSKAVDRVGKTDWGRLFVFAAGVFGTFLTTFAIVLTNHLPGAVSAMVALYATIRIVCDNERRYRYFVVAGVFAAFTAANELPALAFLGLLSVGLLWTAPGPTLKAYLPGTLLVAAGFFGTNYLAHSTLIPPYAFRADEKSENWYSYQYLKDGKVRDSYWMHRESRSPVDQGEPDPQVYAFHALIGHHGIFSLTPIWLLSAVGLGMLVFQSDKGLRSIGLLIAVVSLVCVAFYLARPLDDRNYGGMTSGFRWVFWFAPLWLFAMLPAADLMSRRTWSQWLAAILLGWSVMSVSYPTWNPWTQPWLYDFLSYLGWVSLGAR